jgi:hypothetical protein
MPQQIRYYYSCEKLGGTYNIKFCHFVSGRYYRLKEGIAKEGSTG